jgi:hypothetical protein
MIRVENGLYLQPYPLRFCEALRVSWAPESTFVSKFTLNLRQAPDLAITPLPVFNFRIKRMILLRGGARPQDR